MRRHPINGALAVLALASGLMPLPVLAAGQTVTQARGCATASRLCVVRIGQIEFAREVISDAPWTIALINLAVPNATLAFAAADQNEPDLVFPPGSAWVFDGYAGRAVLVDDAKATQLLSRLMAQGENRSSVRVITPGTSSSTLIDVPRLRADLTWVDARQDTDSTNRKAAAPRFRVQPSSVQIAEARRFSDIEQQRGLTLTDLPAPIQLAHRKHAAECLKPAGDAAAASVMWLQDRTSVFIVACKSGSNPTSRIYRAAGERYDGVEPVSAPVWDAQQRRTVMTRELPGALSLWSGIGQITHEWTVGRCTLIQSLQVSAQAVRLAKVEGYSCADPAGNERSDTETGATLFYYNARRR